MDNLDMYKEETLYKALLEMQTKESDLQGMVQFVKLLFLLDASAIEHRNQNGSKPSPIWITLYLISKKNNTSFLKQYCKHIIDCAENVNLYHKYFKKLFQSIYSSFGHDVHFDQLSVSTIQTILDCSIKRNGNSLQFGTTFIQILELMSEDCKVNAIKAIKVIAADYKPTSISSNKNCSIASFKKFAVFLGAVACSYKMIFCNNSENITSSGFLQIMHVTDLFSRLRGSIINSVSSPAFTICQSLFAAYLGGSCGFFVVHKLFGSQETNHLFVNQDNCLEKSYKFLGLSERASNQEIRKAYRKAALKYHPDKLGRAEDFHELMKHVTTIEFARGIVI